MGALIDNMPPTIEKDPAKAREIGETLQALKREREVYLRRRQMKLVKKPNLLSPRG